MITMAKGLRDRLTKVNTSQYASFQMVETFVTEGLKAIDELRTSLVVKDLATSEGEKIVAEVQQKLDRLSDHLRAIHEATELDRVTTAKLAAGVGQFMEQKELLAEQIDETANIATLQQYFDIAAAGSEPFWLELLGRVDPPIFAAAFKRLSTERKDALQGGFEDA